MVYIISSKEKNPSMLGKLISWYTKSECTHVGILVNDHIYHSVKKGVSKITERAFLTERDYVDKINISHLVDDSKAAEWLESKLGLPYSYSQYYGVFLKWIKFLFVNKYEKFICSEFVYYFYTSLIGKDWIVEHPDFLTPSDVVIKFKGEL